jgi:hypothetical protein
LFILAQMIILSMLYLRDSIQGRIKPGHSWISGSGRYSS